MCLANAAFHCFIVNTSDMLTFPVKQKKITDGWNTKNPISVNNLNL